MQPSKPLTLRHNFSWSFAGNVVYAACQWGMLVVLAKLGSPESLGQFTLGLAVTAPVVLFAEFSLREVQATDAKHQFVFGDYLGLRIISLGLALVAIALITGLAGYRWETSLVILLVGLAKTFESVSDVFHGLLQQHERMDRIAVSMMIKGPVSLLMLGLGLYLSGNIVWGVVGLVFAWAMVLLLYDVRSGALILGTSRPTPLGGEPRQSALRPRWHWRTLGKLAWFALPLGFVTMLYALNINIPRYLIERYLGERALGIFAALSYPMVAGNMVVNPLGQSAIPRLAKYYAVGNSIAFRTLLLKLVGIGALLGGTAVLVALVGGKEILTILYNHEYAQHTQLFVWLMVAAGIGYMSTFLGDGMTAAQRFRIQMPLFLFVTASSAIACLLLLPTWGLQGAAIALLIAVIVRTILSLGVIFHALHQFRFRTE